MLRRGERFTKDERGFEAHGDSGPAYAPCALEIDGANNSRRFFSLPKHEYELIRSKRKSMAIEISREGKLILRVPQRLPLARAEEFLARHEKWIDEKLRAAALWRQEHPEPSEEEREELTRLAMNTLPALVERYSREMGVYPAGISITGARTRFGSCSAKNRLCFSWRLMAYPLEAIEYVVVHELAHIRHKNHAREFYAFIASVMPDYKEREKVLKRR